MRVWRCSEYASLDGEGGLYASGRWHTLGHRITYCAQNSAAALLEVLAHIKGNASLITTDLQYQEIDIPDSVAEEAVNEESLPADWRSRLSITRTIGDRWIESVRTALLRVPSALSPQTQNHLINPRHPAFREIRIVKTWDYALDPRLV